MQNILIVLLGALGDVIRGFSVVAPIKNAYPNCKITWLVEPKCAGIVKLHPLVDEVIVYNRPYNLSLQTVFNVLPDLYSSIQELRNNLKQRNFDLVLDLQRHFKSGFFSKMSGAPRRIGFSKKDCKEFNWIFNTEYIENCDMRRSKVWHYQAFLKKAGIPVDVVDFGMADSLTEDDIPFLLREIALDKLNNSDNPATKLIGFVMGSTWHSKDWFEDYYVELGKSLIREYSCRVVLFGDKTQVGIAERVEKGIDSQRIVNTAGKTSLKELFACLKLADLVVGPDSGPGHLASMVGTPYLSLFGPTTHERVAPFGGEHLVIRTQIACSPCMKRECPGLNKICMRMLTPAIVMKKIAEIREVVGLVPCI